MSLIPCRTACTSPQPHVRIARAIAIASLAFMSGAAVATCAPGLLVEGYMASPTPDFDNVYGEPGWTVHTSYRGSFGYGGMCYGGSTANGWLRSSDSSDRIRIVVDEPGVYDGSLVWASSYNGALVVTGLSVRGTAGFPMQVTLALEDSPTSIAASFPLSSASPSGSFSGIINPGTYTLSITGTDPAVNASGLYGGYQIYLNTMPVPEPGVSLLLLGGLAALCPVVRTARRGKRPSHASQGA